MRSVSSRKVCAAAALISGRRKPRRPLPGDPLESAAIAGLHYVSGCGPCIRRKRAGKGFQYIGPDGKPVRDKATLERIRSLVLPPAWENVWISPLANGHLQAFGYDAKGRKQYRYHAAYRKVRDETKFGRMIAFGAALPAIRRRVDADLRLQGLPKAKVVATVVRLLDTTSIRIGNDEYARANESFGLATLRNRHVQIEGRTLRFRFRGKSGQEQAIELTDRRLARIVKQCQDLPGYELFQYVGDDGEIARVDSSDINEYLRAATGEEFTAKDFRTWAGTGLMALALEQCGPCETARARKKHIAASVKSVAQRLGNRPAAARNYYIHPAILEAYEDGSLLEEMQRACPALDPNDPASLRREEACILGVIERYGSRATTTPAA